MQTVCLFNSTSDLALASDCAPFRPPKGLRAMENDLALLPALCSEEEKEAPLCLTFDALDLAARRGGRTRALRLLPSAPGLPARCEAADIDLRRCLLRPWGWNRDVRLRALRAGLPELLPPGAAADPSLCCGPDTATGRLRLIPSENQLSAWRRLSHRGAWLSLPLPEGPLLRPARKAEVRSAGEAARCLEDWGAASGLMLKRPYSCSGRGLFEVSPPAEKEAPSALAAPHAARWMADGLRLQGSLIAEERLEKASDLALLFRAGYEAAPDGELRYAVRPAGYSLFRTDARGAYRGNLLLPDSLILRRLEQDFGLPPTLLPETAAALARALQERLQPAAYCGCVGVDQMVVRAAGGYRLCPVVEVNLRCTMGFAAHALARRLAAHGALPGGSGAETPPFFTLQARKNAAAPWPGGEARPLLPEGPQALFRAVLGR